MALVAAPKDNTSQHFSFEWSHPRVVLTCRLTKSTEPTCTASQYSTTVPQYHKKAMLGSFCWNGHTLGLHPQCNS